MLEERKYYSFRTGKRGTEIDFNFLKKAMLLIYDRFLETDYFQEAFGMDCVDSGFIPGVVGRDIDSFVLLKLRKDNVWPIHKHIDYYTEEDLFDIIELLYDLVSKPIDGNYHSWQNCGWHYEIFDKATGEIEFRSDINRLLLDYGDGWELSLEGEILAKGDVGLNSLFKATLPALDFENIDQKVINAVLKFRRPKSSIDDRKEAVRELADVLEFLRPQLKQELLTKDEKELFNIANNFGIRHHNQIQKKEYDKAVWLSWIFYIYLSTIHLVTRLINKDNY